jgi:hypothetical protein
MRWSERRTAVRSTFEDDFHTSTPSDVRPRPPSLILFSLDEKAFLKKSVCFHVFNSFPRDMVFVRSELSSIGRVEAYRSRRPFVAHGLRVGFTSSIDVRTTRPSIRLRSFRILLFLYASMDGHHSALLRPPDTSPLAMETSHI